MLTAFEPRLTVQLKARDKSRIECLLAYGDRILVGLSTGLLRVYRTLDPGREGDNEPPLTPPLQSSAESKHPATVPLAECLREEDRFSRKPVQQLAIIKEANILVSLSDSYVSFHDLQTFALTERLESTKGASTFAVTSNIVKDESTNIPSIVSRLAVSVKRKIFIWSWLDMELSNPPSEFTLPASVKSLAWATGSKVMAGMDPGYTLVDTDTQKTAEINKRAAAGEATGASGTRFGAVSSSGMGYMGMGGWVPKPLATKIRDDQMLLAKDVNSLFTDLDGNPLNKRQIPWANAPDAIGYSYPYLISLTPSKGLLEIRNPERLSLLQSISLPSLSYLHIPQPNISLAHAGKGFLVANDRCIWRMEAQGYDSQICELLERESFDEAISLVSTLEDTLLEGKDQTLREIRVAKAEHLFAQRQFRDSLELFEYAHTPPQKVISLYPSIIAGLASRTEEHKDLANDEYKPQSANQTPHKKLSDWKNVAEESSMQNPETSSIHSIKSSGGDGTSPSPSDVVGKEHILEGKDLKRAVSELCAFLAQTRKHIQRYLNFDGSLKSAAAEHESGISEQRPPFAQLISSKTPPSDIDWRKELLDVAVLVDTTLFRAYMFANPSLAVSLFRLDNFCSPDVVKEKLYETGRYTDLIHFLHGKRRHEQALELLEKFGKGVTDDETMEIDVSLRGPTRTVAYLQQLPFEMTDLILKYAEWPLRSDPEVGMEAFLADTESAETLPRDRVVGFLMGIDETLAMRYLEHITSELHDETTEFHDRLIGLYISKMSSRDQNEMQKKLERFLHDSDSFSKKSILSKLPPSDPTYHTSRAVIHSKLHQHLQVLQIHVFDRGSPSSAEAYCNSVYASKSPTSPQATDPNTNVYTLLLSLYLSPPRKDGAPHPRQHNFPEALSLLSRHGSRLPALSTLKNLPDSLPLDSLTDYFRGRMRGAASEVRETSIVSALCGVERAAAERALLVGEEKTLDLDNLDALSFGVEGKAVGASGNDVSKGRSRRVVLGEERMCAVCHKRFGRAALRVWPGGEVLHYGCGEPASRTLGRKRAGEGLKERTV